MIIKNIVIGEDIRQELGNKLSLMGIVGDSINIDIPKEAPKDAKIQVTLAALVTIENELFKQINDFDIQVSMSLEDNQFARMAAKIGAEGNPRVLHVPVPKFGFPLTESVVLTINATILKAGAIISESSYALNVNINRT